MGTGYTRNDTTNNIADGNVINAADLDGEFDAIVTALSTGGHTHDGTAAEGGPVTVLGPAQDFVVSASIVSPKTDNTLDLGTSTLEFKDLYIDGTAYIDGLGEDLLVAGTSKIQFRDTDIHISSATDGHLDLVADTEIHITATTINMDGAADISGNLGVGGNLTVTGTTTFNGGTITLGDAAADNVVFGADVDSSIIPDDDNTYDLGSSGQQWRDIYINGSAYIDGLAEDILVATDKKVQFRDTALFINSSADGQLDIDADVELEITAPTVDINASTAVLISNDLKLDSDAAVLSFGTNSEVTVTHVADTGLTLTHTGTGDNTPIVLQLKSEENELTTNEVIASIEFAAGDDSGTDAATVAAGIHAIAEAEFTSSVNSTKLVFTTGASETAAASATAKMTLSSAGLLTIADDFMLKDGGTIGVASTNDAITIASTGIVTFKDDILIKDAGTIGSASDPDAIAISSGGVVAISATTAASSSTSGALTVAGGAGIAADLHVGDDLVVTGDATFNGDTHTFASTNSQDPLLIIKNTTNDANGSRLHFVKDKGAAGADGDDIGIIEFISDDADQAQTSFAKIVAEVSESLGGDEAGKLSFFVAESDSTTTALTAGLVIEGEHATDGEVDVTIAAGANSTTTVAGDLAVTTDATVGGTLGVTGVVTANAGVVVDNITIDGTEIDLSSGNLTIDVAGYIIIDSDDGNIYLNDGGSGYGQISGASQNLTFKSSTSDKDMIFQGNDGGASITALTLDMSDAGTATFNHDVKATGNFDLPNANTFITGAGHNVVQVDSTKTYLYGGTGGVQFRTADNASALVDITNSGNIGIGISSPTSPLGANFKVLDINSGVWGGTINFSGNSAGYIGNRHSGNTGLGYYAVSGKGHHFAVNGATTAAATLDSSGNLLVGKTALEYTSNAGHIFRNDGLISSIRSGGNCANFNRLASDGQIIQFNKDGSHVGSIGAYSGQVYMADTAAGIRFSGQSTDDVQPCDGNGADKANVNLGASGNAWGDLFLSGGVRFSGAANSSVMDDYEEGTWNPTVNYGSISHNCWYIKVGHMVTIGGNIYNPTNATAGYPFTINALPFSAPSGRSSAGAIIGAYIAAGSWSCYISGGGNQMQFYNNPSSSGYHIMNHSDLATNSDLHFAITYMST